MSNNSATRLPHGISFEEGALLEPLAVAVHACKRAVIKQGSTCTIIGAGPIGLLCAIAARHAGCTQIAIADIVESRVNFACEKRFADVGLVVTGKRAASVDDSLAQAEDTAGSIAELQLPDGTAVGSTDYTFECTGVESCVQTALFVSTYVSSSRHLTLKLTHDAFQTTKSGGRVVLVGMGTPNLTFPISVASAREVDIVPTWRYANAYPSAVEMLIASKNDKSKPQLAEMITHRFNGVDRVPEALQLAGQSKDQDGRMVIKVVVNNYV